MVKLFLTFILVIPSLIMADMQKELNDFFEDFGASANVSSADVYQGQKAGYGTGGSLTVRNRVINSKIATVNLPEIDAGCGGIDIYAGGFSFIKSQELVNTLKNIGASSAGYAFLLGLETVSPQIANTMRQLQSWSNTINSIGINSCETAAQLVGSVWPKNQMASQHICRSMNSKSGILQSYVESRHRCNEDQVKNDAHKELSEKYPDLLMDDYNLSWKAIQKQGVLSGQKELAELFMTMTGTIIVKEQEGKKVLHFLPSKIRDESLLKVILEGGQGTIYSCTDTKQCLTVKEASFKITTAQSWTGKVQNILLQMQEKILDDEELEDYEKDFLSKSRLPLYRIVNVLTAYKKGICPIDLYQIADIVAMDMLAQCLKKGIAFIREGCQQLKEEQMYEERIDLFILDLDKIKADIQTYETKAMQAMDREMQILQKMQILEEQIASELLLY